MRPAVTTIVVSVPYATVYPLVTARALSRAFTYEVEDGVGKGAVVSIGLGRSRVRGVVVAEGEDVPEGVRPIPVTGVLDELPEPLVDLALWVSDYYGSTPARALTLVAPGAPARRGERRSPAARHTLDSTEKRIVPTPSQEHALSRIVELLDGKGGHVLLYGATGSGKTEVYLQACAAALERGRTAIVLVPEIALTPQTLGRFRARFGDAVAVLHSALTDAERRDERERISTGEARIVVGARSAIFAPVRDLGVICIDEEHDQSYKQESDPRYDARTVAAKRASLEGAVAVYGSATPRPESWHTLERIELGGRVGAPLPRVRIVDLRREAGYPLSAPLLEQLERIATHGGRAIILLNRRGVAPAVHCRACGVTRRCPQCDVSLVLHRGDALRCHHCGHAEPAFERCPECGSPELVRIGAGTQRLEAELERHVPALQRIRLDSDTVSKPGALAALLDRFRTTDRCVLLGTQIVGKGHHFAGVDLAAVIDADLGLAMPDFRAEERTFQLVTQLAGRSGREAPGRVIVQTFQPDARPIAYAARQDVPGFLADELDRRRILGYPPFGHVVRVLVAGPSAEDTIRALTELRARLGGDGVLGPAPLPRLRGRHRAQLVVKTDAPRAVAAHVGKLLAAAAPSMRKAGLTVVVDVDPQSF
jgi:primosomal protein N' (replication factor Y) (superfamily II helicase)